MRCRPCHRVEHPQTHGAGENATHHEVERRRQARPTLARAARRVRRGRGVAPVRERRRRVRRHVQRRDRPVGAPTRVGVRAGTRAALRGPWRPAERFVERYWGTVGRAEGNFGRTLHRVRAPPPLLPPLLVVLLVVLGMLLVVLGRGLLRGGLADGLDVDEVLGPGDALRGELRQRGRRADGGRVLVVLLGGFLAEAAEHRWGRRWRRRRWWWWWWRLACAFAVYECVVCVCVCVHGQRGKQSETKERPAAAERNGDRWQRGVYDDCLLSLSTATHTPLSLRQNSPPASTYVTSLSFTRRPTSTHCISNAPLLYLYYYEKKTEQRR